MSKSIKAMSMTAMMAAVICVLSPMSIPIGPVPLSLSTMATFLALYLLGWKLGTVSCAVYILIGLLGIPVFTGFSGGPGKILGPTGGYIIGYIPMALIAGLGIDRSNSRIVQFAAMILGSAVCYIFGTVWFCILMDFTIAAALSTCVFPFIPGDIAKIIIVLTIGPMLRNRLQRAGLQEVCP